MVLKRDLSVDFIGVSIGHELDAIGALLNTPRRNFDPNKEDDFTYRGRLIWVFNAAENGEPHPFPPETDNPRRICWEEGMMFIKKGQDHDSTALYKVLHPGQLGGDVMFVVRLDTGEESLYSRDIHPVIITDPEDITDRTYRAQFALIVNRVRDGNLPMHDAFNQARVLFSD